MPTFFPTSVLHWLYEHPSKAWSDNGDFDLSVSTIALKQNFVSIKGKECHKEIIIQYQ